jgi:hypothetical protein
VKLLLDSMYAPPIAEQLRRRGHDVIAARARPDLADLSDHDLLAAARSDGRVIVTENVRDFIALDAECRQHGCTHAGLILTSSRRFPRGRGAGIGSLVAALDAWLTEHPEDASEANLVWWL